MISGALLKAGEWEGDTYWSAASADGGGGGDRSVIGVGAVLEVSGGGFAVWIGGAIECGRGGAQAGRGTGDHGGRTGDGGGDKRHVAAEGYASSIGAGYLEVIGGGRLKAGDGGTYQDGRRSAANTEGGSDGAVSGIRAEMEAGDGVGAVRVDGAIQYRADRADARSGAGDRGGRGRSGIQDPEFVTVDIVIG